MSAHEASQVLCGPFSSDELPDFQAACVHFDQQWSRFLSVTEQEFVKAIMYRTSRMGTRYRKRRIPMQWFFDGHLGNQRSGYAGCPSMLPVSRKTFYKVRSDLCEYGIVVYSNSEYSIDYSVTALHIVNNEKVQSRVLAANRHGGMLSTSEGIIEWATHCTSLLIQKNTDLQAENPRDCAAERKSSGTVIALNGNTATSIKSQKALRSRINTSIRGDANCSTPTPDSARSGSNEGEKQKQLSPYRVTHNTYVISNDKSLDISGGHNRLTSRNTSQILADVTTSVNNRREAKFDARRGRRNLSDLTKLFEMQWAKGQRDRDSGVPANRIVGADRQLLKNQVIKNIRETKIDVEEFAYFIGYNWQAIGAQYFTKSKRYPERPAMRWFIKCLETYVEAFQQKDFLDEAGTISQTDLMHKAKSAERVQTAAAQHAENAEAEIRLLKAQLREANAVIKGQGKVGNDYEDELSREQRTAIKRRLPPVDFDADTDVKPRKRIRKRR